MKFVKSDNKTYWKADSIDGVRDEGPHCSIYVDGHWVATSMTLADVLKALDDGE